MMQILGMEDRAARLQSSRDNESIVHRKSVPLREIKPKLVRADVDGLDGADRADGGQDLPNLAKLHGQLARSNSGELVENLDADYCAGGDQLFRPVRFRNVL